MSVDVLSMRANISDMNDAAVSQKQIGPLGQPSQEVVAERRARSTAYRDQQDRLAPYRVIARAVILARSQRGYTQRHLAGLLHTTDTAISRIESGERAVSLDTLTRLGQALGIAFVVGDQAAAAGGNVVVVPSISLESGLTPDGAASKAARRTRQTPSGSPTPSRVSAFRAAASPRALRKAR